jgi:hypothetical protein
MKDERPGDNVSGPFVLRCDWIAEMLSLIDTGS